MSDYDLPEGAGLYGLGWYYQNGEWAIIKPSHKDPIKCHCGTTITMGKEDHPQHHSDYCDVYINWAAEEAAEKKRNGSAP